MSVRSTLTLNASLNAEGPLANGGTLLFTDTDLGAGATLATFTCPATAFTTSTANSITTNGVPVSITPSASGTVAGWILKTSGGATIRTGHASELTMSSKVLVQGIAFTFSGLTTTGSAGT